MMRIVLLGRMAAWCHEEIAARLTCEHSITVGEDLDAIEQADVIVGWPLSDRAAARAKNLKLLQVSGAGLDGINFDALAPSIRVANTFHHEVAMAEYVLMAMLILARRPFLYDSQLRKGNWWGSCIWGETPVIRELHGQTMLLIGLGHIAREVAVRAKAFGMHVIGASRHRHEGPYDEQIPFSQWQDRLPEADWVIPCCPLTPETVDLIGEPQIERMKKSACIVNITRGRVLNEEAVFDALRNKRIAGAAIDVWYQYPSHPDEVRFPSRFPFHELDNVFMSPHNSGWTLRCILARAEDIAENINRLAEGRELINVVR